MSNRGTFPSGGVIAATDPLLSAPANNGGPTQTMALGATSPAIDAGTNNPGAPFGALPGTDQRGIARIVNTTVDIGAFELTTGPSVISVSPSSGPLAGGTSVTVLWVGVL